MKRYLLFQSLQFIRNTISLYAPETVRFAEKSQKVFATLTRNCLSEKAKALTIFNEFKMVHAMFYL